MTRRLLLVEPDPVLRDQLRNEAEEVGFEVIEVQSGAEALAEVRLGTFAAAVVEVELPDVVGYELIRRLHRQRRDMILIAVSDSLAEVDRDLARLTGADGFLCTELGFVLGDLRATLAEAERASRRSPWTVDVNDITIDFVAREVRRNGEPLPEPLTELEFNVLEAIALHAGELVSRERITIDVWGFGKDFNEHTADRVHLCKVRLKLDDDEEHPRYIFTDASLGYHMPAGVFKYA